MNRKLAALGVGALLVGAVACASGGKGSGTSSPPGNTAAPASPSAAATTAAAVPAGPKTSFGDGTWEVGKDIAAGKYTTTVAGDAGCYWERLKGFSGGFDDIIANGNGVGRVIVTIAATDKGFKSSNCGTWTKA